jgi:2-haloacid dehalogenase
MGFQYNSNQTMKCSPKAVLFDAYGTLFDVYSIGQLAEQMFPGQGERLANMWRDKQVEYTRLRSMAGRYKPFSELTRDALMFCGEALGLAMTPAAADALMQQYGRLEAFPENLGALKRMRDAGLPLAIHSNGEPEWLAGLIEQAGFSGLFEAVLSAHQVGCYKVDARVYQLAPDVFRCKAEDLLFVSSNGWDACGATWFGFKTFWVNRRGAPNEWLDVAPTFQGRNLDDVAKLVC